MGIIINLLNKDNPKTIEELRVLVAKGQLDKSILPITDIHNFNQETIDDDGLPVEDSFFDDNLLSNLVDFN